MKMSFYRQILYGKVENMFNISHTLYLKINLHVSVKILHFYLSNFMCTIHEIVELNEDIQTMNDPHLCQKAGASKSADIASVYTSRVNDNDNTMVYS